MDTFLTVFAGRRRYLEISRIYFDLLLERGTVTEVHLWDYARNADDSECIARRGTDPFAHAVDNTADQYIPPARRNIEKKLAYGRTRVSENSKRFSEFYFVGEISRSTSARSTPWRRTC